MRVLKGKENVLSFSENCLGSLVHWVRPGNPGTEERQYEYSRYWGLGDLRIWGFGDLAIGIAEWVICYWLLAVCYLVLVELGQQAVEFLAPIAQRRLAGSLQ